jgi:WD40 repeat protein
MKTLAGHNSWVRTVAISPNGRHIASGSGDRTVGLWTLARWQAGALPSGPYRLGAIGGL